MQLVIAAVGNKMPAWISAGFDEYAKRMPPELRMTLKEIKPVDRSGGKTAAIAMRLEHERIEAAITKGTRRIVLDEHGRDLTTLELAHLLTQWQLGSQDVTFIIGGADGLDPLCKTQADMQIRLSSLTLPHAMVRVILAEQLYRAWSVTQNHPYHRA